MNNSILEEPRAVTYQYEADNADGIENSPGNRPVSEMVKVILSF